MKDQGQRVTRESAMAKLFASEMAVRDCQRGGADSRRVRLHQGLSGGEVLPRREAVHHRRGHQRDPAPGDRAPIAEEHMTDPRYAFGARSRRSWPATAAASRTATRRRSTLLAQPATGSRHLGITGPPGAGKSTLVDRAGGRSRAREGRRVGIMAVDPTSPYRRRDSRRSHPHATPSRRPGRVHPLHGHAEARLGGLARATADLAVLLDAAGYDYVVISKRWEWARTRSRSRDWRDVTVMVLVPGMGDDVQAIKAGIMEIADVFVDQQSRSCRERTGWSAR